MKLDKIIVDVCPAMLSVVLKLKFRKPVLGYWLSLVSSELCEFP
jgi:hypothetical protein